MKRKFVLTVFASIFALACFGVHRVLADASEPKVELNADNLAPRTIEDRTSQVVPRDYGFAWQSMAKALDENHAGLLSDYFTGQAKDNLASVIADQQRDGIHTHYVDHGHKLNALFYSPAGDAMELRDTAQLEIQVLAGDKVIDSEQVTLHYLVLMTPGADRWLVRDLENIPEGQK